MMRVVREISGWGRHPRLVVDELLGEDLERLTRDVVLTRGLGRSYGDSSLPPREGARVACTRMADRILRFDPKAGALRAEAGLSLARLEARMLPRGYASPVVPGTQHVTIGGMVAADVHGKNQHRAGSFGDHVRSLRMRLADGRIVEVNESREPELFRATIGGMGLTGHILEVEFTLERIPSPWIWREHQRVDGLDALLDELGRASASWPYTVAWVDCLTRGPAMGRGIVIKGRWATADEAPQAKSHPRTRTAKLAVPFELPGFVLSRPAVRTFNELYYRWLGAPTARGISDPQHFFYPLDAIRNWNRLYGKRGFTQYQCVLPRAEARRLFEVLTRHGGASFLAVVKDFGRTGRGLLSFPMPGVTVSLDVPLRGEKTQRLVDALNEVVAAAGGRIYLAKDTLTRPDHFRAMEPRLAHWNAVRRTWVKDGAISSAQAVRLLGDGA
jgi:decaprenylphospho-beta-D-ribofuranose 2-oxidase